MSRFASKQTTANPSRPTTAPLRHLVVVLGDQLDAESAAFDDFDPRHDAVWMAEVAEESTHVWSHQARTALFLSAMRHFRDELRQLGRPLFYRAWDDPDNRGRLAAELDHTLTQTRPQRVIVVEPGDYRVRQDLHITTQSRRIPLDVRTDRHFLCTTQEFAEHVRGRKQLRLEYFYRELRRRTGLLMDGHKPLGGSWNYDSANRAAFGVQGPPEIPPPRAFAPDALTHEVLRLTRDRLADHPGRLDRFDWPVTRSHALQALDDFITHRLPQFGRYQDAMWTHHPYLFHSRLSAALNVKLLRPWEVVQAAERAFHAGHAPLTAVEGFIRQIIGWREYVRGIYWHFMPAYLDGNFLEADRPLPQFYWTGQTEMNCLRHAIGQTLEYGYAHHIQRLMVTGLYALLLGVRPRAVHEWYLAVYVDAVEWVEVPNTLGMSQFADGGLMASKPYVASGKYLDRMSNYCQGCRYRPEAAVGPEACPLTTLYWNFLDRHANKLRSNPRMSMQLRNLERLDRRTRLAIARQAESHRGAVG